MKTDFTLLPPNAIKLVAELLTKGLEKYPDEKWRTLSVKDHLAATLRHINAYLRGEAFDEDSPSHLINAATRLLFATELEALMRNRYQSLQDDYQPYDYFKEHSYPSPGEAIKPGGTD